MTRRVKSGALAKAVHKLCSDTLLGWTSESGFKGGLKEIIDDYRPRLGNLGLGDIGRAIQAWLNRYAKDRTESVWGLVDEVDPEVRDEYKRQASVYSGTSSVRDKERVAKFAITLEADEDSFIVASCPALPGCHSQGRTKEEAIANIREAIQGYVVSMRKHGEPIPTTEVEEVEVVV
ncbi:MAG: type II toxin-antitoxin system HicB family antitoxin [Dehalococcoidia bacterium]|nr:type II toxin-antitoxin system HicB family antitoxin [Dehalococcoidia bacterium]